MRAEGSRRDSGRRGVVAVAFALSVAGAADAAAAERYAAPTGAGTACTQADPCDIETAVDMAPANSEVIVGPGEYDLGTTSLAPAVANIDIHGVAGQTRPRIFGAGDGAPARLIELKTADSTLRWLRIERTGVPAADTYAVRLDGPVVGSQLIVSSTAQHTCHLSFGAVLRDSVCTNSEATGFATAVRSEVATNVSSASRLRNVTAIASGQGGVGVTARASGMANVSLNLLNVIATGQNPLGDIAAFTAGAGDTSSITAAHSNYDAAASVGGTVTFPNDPGANIQTDPPVYIDAASGDYRQAASSPTLNAGVIDGFVGTFDFEDEARIQGTAIDIGADERDQTPPETAITDGPNETTADATPTFSFTAPTATTFACTLDGTAVACSGSPFTTQALGLGPHVFTVAGVDAFGNVDETPATRSFTVVAPDPDPDPDPHPEPDREVSAVNVDAKRKQAQGETIKVKVRGGAGEAVTATAKGKVTVPGEQKPLRLKKVTKQVAAGAQERLKLVLVKEAANETVVEALAAGLKPKATLSVTLTDAAGNTVTVRRTVTLKSK